MDDAIAIAAGVRHGLALLRDGTIWMWVQDDLPKSNFGTALPSTAFRPQLRRIDGLPRITKIAAADRSSFALAEDGWYGLGVRPIAP